MSSHLPIRNFPNLFWRLSDVVQQSLLFLSSCAENFQTWAKKTRLEGRLLSHVWIKWHSGLYKSAVIWKIWEKVTSNNEILLHYFLLRLQQAILGNALQRSVCNDLVCMTYPENTYQVHIPGQTWRYKGRGHKKEGDHSVFKRDLEINYSVSIF